MEKIEKDLSAVVQSVEPLKIHQQNIEEKLEKISEGLECMTQLLTVTVYAEKSKSKSLQSTTGRKIRQSEPKSLVYLGDDLNENPNETLDVVATEFVPQRVEIAELPAIVHVGGVQGGRVDKELLNIRSRESLAMEVGWKKDSTMSTAMESWDGTRLRNGGGKSGNGKSGIFFESGISECPSEEVDFGLVQPIGSLSGPHLRPICLSRLDIGDVGPIKGVLTSPVRGAQKPNLTSSSSLHGSDDASLLRLTASVTGVEDGLQTAAGDSPLQEEVTLPVGLRRDSMPRHVAVIMDGNSRWARRRGLPRSAGHEYSSRSLWAVVDMCRQWGIGVLGFRFFF